jgi:hypothetical protein
MSWVIGPRQASGLIFAQRQTPNGPSAKSAKFQKRIAKELGL